VLNDITAAKRGAKDEQRHDETASTALYLLIPEQADPIRPNFTFVPSPHWYTGYEAEGTWQ